MPKSYPAAVTGILLSALLCCSTSMAFVHKNAWPQWEINNPLSKETISHRNWQIFLNRHVSTNSEGINLVDYPHLSAADMHLLKQYTDKLARTPIQRYNRAEQLAFWLNLYNALIVQMIASHYPIGSIEEINISPSLFSIGPWKAKLITINHTPLSLDDIQNRIIRPIWNDARTLYALNNGSIGAPNLNKEAYTRVNLEHQLNQAAIEYINSLRGVQVIEGRLIVSKIYEWYNEDFGGSKQNIINHIKLFARDPLKNQLKHINTIDNYFYNWHLNSTTAGSA